MPNETAATEVLRHSALLRDPEMLAFVRERMARMPCPKLLDACRLAYPDKALPARSTLYRLVRAELGDRGRGQWSTLEESPELATHVLANAAGMTLNELLQDCRRLFPSAPQPSRSALARFLRAEFGIRSKGKPSTIARHPDLAAFVQARARRMTVDKLLAECRAAFPAVPVSRTGLHRAIRVARESLDLAPSGRARPKRRPLGRQPSIEKNPELAAFIRRQCEGATIWQVQRVRKMCAGAFPDIPLPSRSTLARFMRRELGVRVQNRIAADVELQAYLRQRAPGASVPELRNACLRRFGAVRTPSLSALHRWMKKHRAGPRRGVLLRMNGERKLASFIRERQDKITLDALLTACREAFPAVALSRSVLHRFVQARRNASPSA